MTQKRAGVATAAGRRPKGCRLRLRGTRGALKGESPCLDRRGGDSTKRKEESHRRFQRITMESASREAFKGRGGEAIDRKVKRKRESWRNKKKAGKTSRWIQSPDERPLSDSTDEDASYRSISEKVPLRSSRPIPDAPDACSSSRLLPIAEDAERCPRGGWRKRGSPQRKKRKALAPGSS